eukprot:scaffold74288_cov21-Phaeocystis_antarctica.AAC.1
MTSILESSTPGCAGWQPGCAEWQLGCLGLQQSRAWGCRPCTWGCSLASGAPMCGLSDLSCGTMRPSEG